MSHPANAAVVHARRGRAVLAATLVPGLVACDGEGSTQVQLATVAVTTSTSGDNLDPDGYTVTLEGDSRPIATDATVVFSDLEPGDYSVELSGIADNCSLDGANRVTVVAIGGATALVLFTVTCGALTGSLEVRTLTTGGATGGAIDPDGYIVNVDQFLSLPIGVNDPGVTISDLAAGSHIVELVDVAANCVVSDPNPRTMNIRPAALTQALFRGDLCLANADQIVFGRSWRGGGGALASCRLKIQPHL